MSQEADILKEVQESFKNPKPTKTENVKKKKSRVVDYLFLTGIVLVILSIGAVIVARKATDWGAEHQIVDQQVLFFKVQLPWKIEKRRIKEVISPLSKEAAEVKETLTPIEEKILNKWGPKHGYVALAVLKCESRLRSDAVNWQSKDVGIAQINWPIWEKPVKEKFGYTLKDMFDEDKNLEVAYWIWDRADGKDGDGKGSFEAWVAFTTGAFARCIK